MVTRRKKELFLGTAKKYADCGMHSAEDGTEITAVNIIKVNSNIQADVTKVAAATDGSGSGDGSNALEIAGLLKTLNKKTVLRSKKTASIP
ncbi:hypothetical protein [Moorella sp. E308F]|uniref:hypothetical protein n=1 Tax=Moorella sp. E308F TaxID=2572682 RepID=UPI001144CABA|nr:hypothetical protein [Moorella sp. E308F]